VSSYFPSAPAVSLLGGLLAGHRDRHGIVDQRKEDACHSSRSAANARYVSEIGNPGEDGTLELYIVASNR